MTPSELLGLSRLPSFPQSASELIRIIGLKAAAQLISAWPGQEFPVPSAPGGLTEAGGRNWARLVKVVGEPAAAKIVRYWSRCMLYVPSCEEARMSLRQDAVRAGFDRLVAAGKSYPEAVFELGLKHRLTGRAVKAILKRSYSYGCFPVHPGAFPPLAGGSTEAIARSDFLLSRPRQPDLIDALSEPGKTPAAWNRSR
jgi:hypothetical protein